MSAKDKRTKAKQHAIQAERGSLKDLRSAIDLITDLTQSDEVFSEHVIFTGETDSGIKVDHSEPGYPWRDLEGQISIRGTGGTNPTFAVYRGGIRQFRFGVNDEAFLEFHMPHDYVPGSEMFLHFHWSHIVDGVTSGSVTWGAEMTYAKGFNQAAFVAPVNLTVSEDAPTEQYQHMVTETQMTLSGGSASRIDTDTLETDGLILVRAFLSANTMNGGALPFLHRVDIHYQSTNIGTKNKAPSFYK